MIGESPSSYFSDVDNLNNEAQAEQPSSTKGVTSPLAIEGLIIPAQNRARLTQVFTFVSDLEAMQIVAWIHDFVFYLRFFCFLFPDRRRWYGNDFI